jgi:two-component system sensor histidine kinase/response regulator
MFGFYRRRITLRAKVLLLSLSIALPPLIIVCALALTSFDSARDTAVQVGASALREQAEAELALRAADKARLYDGDLTTVRQQVEAVASYAQVLIAAGPPPPTGAGRVWIPPDGPDPISERENAAAVARARQFTPLLRSVVEQNPLVSLGYIGLEESGVATFDKDIVDVLRDIQPFDVRERSWYTAARAAGRTVWVDTYVDANTKRLTTTCATPLYDAQGRFLGVVGFDVLLDTIRADVMRLDMGDAGSAFLINDRGDLLVHSDMNTSARRWGEAFNTENLLATDDPRLRDVVERMTQRGQGVEQVAFQGGDVYLAYAPIESAGWSVGIVVPVAEVVRPAADAGATIVERQNQLRAQLIGLLILGLVSVPLLGIFLSMLLTRRLRILKGGAQRIAAGDLAYRVETLGNDEIGDLGRSFNAMTDTLQQKVNELEENLGQLASLNDVSNEFRAILSFSELLDAVPRGACRCFGFDRAVLYLLEGAQLRAVSAAFGPGREAEAAQFMQAAGAMPIAIDSPTVEADIVRSGQAVIITDPWRHPRVIQSKQELSRSEAYIQVPIYGREEKIIGVLSADFHYSQRTPTPRDAAQLLTYASMVGLTIENTRVYSELERQVAQRTAELRDAFERAQEADRLKGQFLAAISHELRTPLNAIIGFSTVMLDELDGPISPLQREDLKIINRNGRFLLHLINDLLDLARIEAGKLELDIQPLDVHTLVNDVVETVHGILYNKKTVLRVSLPDQLPPVRADAAKARQVLLNLIANAVKFTGEGTITISAQAVVMTGESNESGTPGGVIVRDGRRLRPYIAISVRDTGIGIAPDHLPLIFEEFHQVDPHDRRKRGTGLGLSISRKLVEAHGGRIWVESASGQGSVFTFTLPCHIESLATRTPQRAESPQIAESIR